jgi:hypothetical protein
MALKVILGSCEGDKRATDRIRYRLPNKSGSALYCSGTDVYLPAKIKPATTANESELITCLIGELRSKLALDLDASPSFERGLALQSKTKKSVDFLLIGSSNARRLMAVLSEMGFSASIVYLPHFRIYRGSDEQPTRMMQEAIADHDPGTIIIHMMDKITYCAKSWDGGRHPPKKGPDGVYHMEGDVVVEPKEVQRENFKAIKPILGLVGKRRGIMISPMPRYRSKPCCDNVDHFKNLKDTSYKSILSASLKEAKQNLKDFLFTDGRRNFRVPDPNIDIQSLKEEDVWGADPVHPLPAVFSKLAEAVAKTVATMQEHVDRKRSNEDRGDGPASTGDERRFRTASFNTKRPQSR